MKEVEHAVIVTNITGGATKFWIKTDRSGILNALII